MKMIHAPEVMIQTKPDQLVCSPSEQVSQGGGASSPGLCESPPKTAGARASVSVRARSSFLIGSPIEVVELGGFAVKTPHHTVNTDPALVLFRSYADRKDFDSLITLCRDRYHAARDRHTLIRWRKDESIAESLRGNYLTAHGLLDDINWLAEMTTGAVRGKYENEFGIMLARLGRSSLALERFNLGYQHSRTGKDFLNCARVDHNRARALVTRGEHMKAARYIRRALNFARSTNDYRLELEVLESIKEFGGMS